MHDLGQFNKHNPTNEKLKALDRLAARSTTTITRNTPQASVEIMIDLMPIELMIQKTGISAYIRLRGQLSVPFQATGKMVTLGEPYK